VLNTLQCLAKPASPRTQAQRSVRHTASKDYVTPPNKLGIALTCQNTCNKFATVILSFGTAHFGAWRYSKLVCCYFLSSRALCDVCASSLLPLLLLPFDFPRLRTIAHSQHLTLHSNINAQSIHHYTDKYRGDDKEKEGHYKHANVNLSFRREDDVLVEIDHDG
jgi:hypothetical protein